MSSSSIASFFSVRSRAFLIARESPAARWESLWLKSRSKYRLSIAWENEASGCCSELSRLW
jgi:hypothetical protein